MKRLALFVCGFLLMACLAACGQKAPAQDPFQALKESIQVEDQTLSFTLPAQPDSGWQVQIAGRLLFDGQGMSVHYLDGSDWAAGQSYSFPLDKNYVSLELFAYLEDGQETTIDLLPFLPPELLTQ